MKNNEVIKDFANGITGSKTENVFTEGKVLYSYGRHFPMAFKLRDSQCLFNIDKYSMSTSRHQNATSMALQSKGWKLIFVHTDQIKEAIDRNIGSLNELMIENI